MDSIEELFALSDMFEADFKEMEDHHNKYEFFDDNTGEPLDAYLVRLACSDELDRFAKMRVYHHVRREDINGKLVRCVWVRAIKGTKDMPKVKCRLVAMEFGNGDVREDIFAGTPPLYAVHVVIFPLRQPRSSRAEDNHDP
jgi:hypothetical protein